MLIKNLTKRTAISKNARLVDSFLLQSIGLMFSKRQNKALVFKFSNEKTISLHMLFVFYPIDVLFLDKNKTVVDKKENFMPFAFYKSKKMAMYAVELPNNTIKRSRTALGDKIWF